MISNANLLQKDLLNIEPGAAAFEKPHPWLRQSHTHCLLLSSCCFFRAAIQACNLPGPHGFEGSSVFIPIVVLMLGD